MVPRQLHIWITRWASCLQPTQLIQWLLWPEHVLAKTTHAVRLDKQTSSKVSHLAFVVETLIALGVEEVEVVIDNVPAIAITGILH